MQNITVQKIALFLVTVGAFFFAPWICAETLAGNSIPLSLTLGVGFLLVFMFALGDSKRTNGAVLWAISYGCRDVV